MSWKEFNIHINNIALPRLHKHKLGTIHELRAAFACDVYFKITRFPPPCISGFRLPEKEDDYHAREIISYYLGHGRINVVGAYIGGMQ